MATKTISLRLDAYERLEAARRSPDESFTQVILRASWPETSIRADELLRWIGEHRSIFSESGLRQIEELTLTQEPPEDKWSS